LAHPSHRVERVYHVTVRGIPSKRDLEALTRGVEVDDEWLAADRARRLDPADSANRSADNANRSDVEGSSTVEVVLHRGRKREIRRMFRAIAHPVIRLVRTRFGPVRLGSLASGAYRELEPDEKRALRDLVRNSGLDDRF
jgi:pseudouridine synthase